MAKLFIWQRFKHFLRDMRLRIRSQVKIRNKLLLLVLLLTAINFTFFAFLSMGTKTSYVLWDTERENQAHAGELARFIDNHFTELFNRIQVKINALPPGAFKTEESFTKIWKSLGNKFPTLQGVILSNHKYQVIYDYCRTLDDCHAWTGQCDYFQNPSVWRKTPMIKLGQAHFFSKLSKVLLPVEYELPAWTYSGSPRHLVLCLDFTELTQTIRKWRLGPRTEIILINAQGKILFHSRLPPGTALDKYLLQVHEKLSVRPASTFSYSSFKVVSSPNDQDLNVLRAYAPCPSLGWGVFVEQDALVINRRVNRVRWILLALLAGPLLLTLSLGLWLIHQLVRPLEELENGIRLFETGLLADPLPQRSQDEIGRLTQAFNQMVQTLVMRNDEIRRKTSKLTFFNEITTIINQSVELNKFLDRALKKILQNMNTSAGWIYIFDPQLKQLRLVAQAGLPEPFLAALREKSFSETLIKKTYTSGLPSLVRDVSRFLNISEGERPGRIQDALLVPLRSKHRTVGILSIASNQKYLLQYKDMDQLTRIGGELGIAIENALLYIELQLKIKEREEVNRELQELDRFKNRFLSNVSHELRTPITSIKSYVDLFLADKIGPLTADQKDKLRVVQRNVNHLLSLINDLLTLARVQDRQSEMKNLEIHIIQDVIDNVIADTIEMAKSKGLDLTRGGVQTGVMVEINRLKMQQVLQNLISNAIKFTDQGSVTVEVRSLSARPPQAGADSAEKAPRVEISVRDTGIGIPKHSQDRIFQRFFQVDSSSTRKYVGTGLGLAIVKEILEAHGTEIHVESKAGQGSRFWFTLPIVPAPKIN